MIQEAATQMDGIDFSVINDISYISTVRVSKSGGISGKLQIPLLDN